MTTPAHVHQLDGSAWAGYGCMGAAGAMALDAYTGGRIRVSMHAIRAAQDDRSGGIGLDDVATAWRRGWGLRFDHGPYAWSTILGRLGGGQGAVITLSYIGLGSWRAPGSTFTGPHAAWLDRPGLATVNGRQVPGIVVHDPLRRGPVTIPETVVKRAYSGGAGWGHGTYAPAPGVDPLGVLATVANPVTWPSAVAGAIGASGGTPGAIALGAGVDAALAGVSDVLGRTALLIAIVALALLGVALTFREPLTVAGRSAVRARTGGAIG